MSWKSGQTLATMGRGLTVMYEDVRNRMKSILSNHLEPSGSRGEVFSSTSQAFTQGRNYLDRKILEYTWVQAANVRKGSLSIW